LEKKNRAPTGGPEVLAAEGRERECCARGPGRWAENELGRSRRGGGGKLGSGAKLGCGLGKKARRWLGREADREGFPLSLFFFQFLFQIAF